MKYNMWAACCISADEPPWLKPERPFGGHQRSAIGKCLSSGLFVAALVMLSVVKVVLPRGNFRFGDSTTTWSALVLTSCWGSVWNGDSILEPGSDLQHDHVSGSGALVLATVAVGY